MSFKYYASDFLPQLLIDLRHVIPPASHDFYLQMIRRYPLNEDDIDDVLSIHYDFYYNGLLENKSCSITVDELNTAIDSSVADH